MKLSLEARAKMDALKQWTPILGIYMIAKKDYIGEPSIKDDYFFTSAAWHAYTANRILTEIFEAANLIP